MAEASSPKKRKVTGAQLVNAIAVHGANRTFLFLDAQWAKDCALELEREGGMVLAVRWTQRHPSKGPVRCEALAQCTQIDFEAAPA